MGINVKYIWFPYFLVFLVFNHDFIICTDFTGIAASNTANLVTHRNLKQAYNILLLLNFILKN